EQAAGDRGRPIGRAGGAAGGRAGLPVDHVVAVGGGVDAGQRRAGAVGRRRPGGGATVVDVVYPDVGKRIPQLRIVGLADLHVLAAVVQRAGVGAEDLDGSGDAVLATEGGRVNGDHQRVSAG